MARGGIILGTGARVESTSLIDNAECKDMVCMLI